MGPLENCASFCPKKCNCRSVCVNGRVEWPFNIMCCLRKYSGNLKSDHLKSGNIWNSDFLKVRFQMAQWSNSRALALDMAIVPTIQKPDHLKSGGFCQVSNGFWQNGSHLSEFQIVGLPDFRSHLNPDHLQPNLFWPFKIQTMSDFRFPLYVLKLRSYDLTFIINVTFLYKLSRGEICVANLKAPLRIVWVWVVNKSEKMF